jgi:hypothetical protein
VPVETELPESFVRPGERLRIVRDGAERPEQEQIARVPDTRRFEVQRDEIGEG